MVWCLCIYLVHVFTYFLPVCRGECDGVAGNLGNERVQFQLIAVGGIKLCYADNPCSFLLSLYENKYHHWPYKYCRQCRCFVWHTYTIKIVKWIHFKKYVACHNIKKEKFGNLHLLNNNVQFMEQMNQFCHALYLKHCIIPKRRGLGHCHKSSNFELKSTSLMSSIYSSNCLDLK